MCARVNRRAAIPAPEFFKTLINRKVLAKGKDTCDKIITTAYRELGSALLSSRS